MTSKSEREFWVDAYRASMTFVRDSMGKVSSLMYRGRTAPRVIGEEKPVNYADYVGDYESDELFTTYTVAVRDTSLVVRHFRRGTLRLVRAYDDDFRSGGSAIRFERNTTGRVVGFLVDGGERNRNVKFKRRASGM
jgi:hypothetical protein